MCRPCMGYTCAIIQCDIIVTEQMFSANTCNSEVDVDNTKSGTSPQANALLSMCGCFVLL